MQNRREAMNCILQRRRFVAFSGPVSPNRPQPRMIIQIARDHVHMKLRNGIAQGTYVDLAALRCRLQKFGRMGNFTPQLRLFPRGQIKSLGQAISSRHQNEPRITAVVHQQYRT